MVRADAYAKINLALDITGKRPDGYHGIKTVMQELSLHDHVDLEINADPFVKLFVTGAGAEIPTDVTNAAVKAANLMREIFRIPEGVSIHITKRIPAASGLGGGSADAAAVIRGMNVLFGLGLDTGRMAELGAKIGADVPFCVLGGTALAEGIGEKLTVLPAMPEFSVLLVKPAEGISTAEAYEAFDALSSVPHPDVDGAAALLRGKPEKNAQWLKAFGNHCGNVLEAIAGEKLPVIPVLRKALEEDGAEFSMMSGSGSCVYGLFAEETKAWEAAEKMKESFADFPEMQRPEIIVTRIRSNI